MRWLVVIAVLLAGCAGVAVKRPSGEWIVVSEWFRSGKYVVGQDRVSMETEAMSPVLGGVMAGAAAAGLQGAAAGGGVGLLSEGVDLLVKDGDDGGDE